jgi:hypothetical protein
MGKNPGRERLPCIPEPWDAFQQFLYLQSLSFGMVREGLALPQAFVSRTELGKQSSSFRGQTPVKDFILRAFSNADAFLKSYPIFGMFCSGSKEPRENAKPLSKLTEFESGSCLSTYFVVESSPWTSP